MQSYFVFHCTYCGILWVLNGEGRAILIMLWKMLFKKNKNKTVIFYYYQFKWMLHMHAHKCRKYGKILLLNDINFAKITDKNRRRWATPKNPKWQLWWTICSFGNYLNIKRIFFTINCLSMIFWKYCSDQTFWPMYFYLYSSYVMKKCSILILLKFCLN